MSLTVVLRRSGEVSSFRHGWFWLACLICTLGCRSHAVSRERPSSAAPVEVAAPATFQALWDRISAWYLANAPEGECLLAQPASDETIAAAETTLGRPLPADLRALYQVGNGSLRSGVFGGYYLLSLEDLCEETATWEDLIGSAWSRREGWIPFTANGGGDHHCLDASERVFSFSHETGRQGEGGPTLRAWLEQFVEELESDRWVYSAEDEQIVRRK